MLDDKFLESIIRGNSTLLPKDRELILQMKRLQNPIVNAITRADNACDRISPSEELQRIANEYKVFKRFNDLIVELYDRTRQSGELSFAAANTPTITHQKLLTPYDVVDWFLAQITDAIVNDLEARGVPSPSPSRVTTFSPIQDMPNGRETSSPATVASGCATPLCMSRRGAGAFHRSPTGEITRKEDESPNAYRSR